MMIRFMNGLLVAIGCFASVFIVLMLAGLYKLGAVCFASGMIAFTIWVITGIILMFYKEDDERV